MERRVSVTAFIVSGLLLAVAGSAGAFQIKTGKWQVETEMRNPMSPQPQVETSIECITEESFDPAQAMMESGQCTITDKQDSGDSVSWTFRCGGDGMPVSTGTGKFVSSGKSASGELEMNMEFNGQTMTMSNSWKGQHIADTCD